VKSGTLFRSGNLSQRYIVNKTVDQHRGRVAYDGRYMTLRSVAKSAAVSEDTMRGQPFGDSAAARFDFANTWLSTEE